MPQTGLWWQYRPQISTRPSASAQAWTPEFIALGSSTGYGQQRGLWATQSTDSNLACALDIDMATTSLPDHRYSHEPPASILNFSPLLSTFSVRYSRVFLIFFFFLVFLIFKADYFLIVEFKSELHFIYSCVVEGACHGMCVEPDNNLGESVLSFYHIGLELRALRLGGKLFKC